MTKTIEVKPEVIALCFVKAKKAKDLKRQEIESLMTWCDGQSESLWEDMSLQEILNVYRVSAEWESWEDWADEDMPAAYKAWDRAVIDPGNKMAYPAY